MLDFFSIFSKGGIVLWCFQGTSQWFTPSVNALIKSVLLQERSGSSSYTHESLTLKYRLDNEYELVFVVAYQKILQLSYVDKFLTAIQVEFRNKYKDDLQRGNISRNFDFREDFNLLLKETVDESILQAQKPRKMKSYEESQKSKKTVASMIENRKEDKKKKEEKNNKVRPTEVAFKMAAAPVKEEAVIKDTAGELDEETIRRNIEKKFKKKPAKQQQQQDVSKSPEDKKKKGKVARKWDNCVSKTDAESLDFSSKNGLVNGDITDAEVVKNLTSHDLNMKGQMMGDLKDMEPESSSEEEEIEEEIVQKPSKKSSTAKSKSSGFGMFTMFKNLVGSKTLTMEDIQPVVDKMKDHLIAKNVASDIALKLCESVAAKLEGKVLGTFDSITTTVKNTLNESCVQILSPRRRIDILRDAMEAKQQRRPYCITFCGVNGVGKSTNLAKVGFWLVENGLRVLIAACDTFRAGAVEQLRTHTRKLNALHSPEMHGGVQMVQLYEKGYGKDAASIAMEAINFARDNRIDVVLIDTAGRMQDNVPLMKALAKLIKVNQPDLVLFVGEALVGNEAVDQLTKFNQALADNSNMANPRLIDGIILTKFDTIDDKVGAAISMTYTTGQPIVFVGTGQTYTDLRNLNTKAVVQALLKA
ncbi:signal recognition particle receptor subunit alpha isoform X1 [Octopus sinensis]|uniref:Signal recognition particle receptor subunit alpha isoform X1 n=1 Tax=Octopus sinensis TaxID=2607531 RepID=A0A6P7T9P8_9MOLL|nr:signal recognition particle receptor subunit alpha isoform X1 [Octopus sinensis]